MKQTMLSLAAAALLAGSSAVALAQTNDMGTNSNTTAPSTAPTAHSPGTASGNSMSNSMSNVMHGHMMSSDQVKQIQSALDQKGQHLTVDGKWGKQTAAAVRNFQKENGLRATGHADQKTMQKLGLSG